MLSAEFIIKSVTLLNHRHAFFCYRDPKQIIKIGRFDLKTKVLTYNTGELKYNGRFDVELISTRNDKTLIFCMAYCDKPYFAQAN